MIAALPLLSSAGIGIVGLVILIVIVILILRLI